MKLTNFYEVADRKGDVEGDHNYAYCVGCLPSQEEQV